MNQVTDRIINFNRSRIPELVKLKYGLMAQNQFRFYRGTCHLFYEDYSKHPLFTQAPAAWICGDLHLENFGSFRSMNEQVYFDLNDFDEAVLAPVTMELLRLVTSIFIGFDSLEIEHKRANKMAGLFLRSYCETLAKGKADYVESNTAQGIVKDFLIAANEKKQKHLLDKKTRIEKNKLTIHRDGRRHFEIDNDLKSDLFHHVNDWLRNDENSPYNYKVCDGVLRIAGTGSVGLKRYAFLLKTLNKTGERYMMLDMKQAATSSLIPYLSYPQPDWSSEAIRIMEVQKKMQNRCPALLSHSVFDGEPFIMQEMQPTEDSIDFKLLKKRYRDMYQVVDTMAMLTASSQLRSAGQNGSAIVDDLKAFAAMDGWQKEVLGYCAEYSHQVKADYSHFLEDYSLLMNEHFIEPVPDPQPGFMSLKLAL